MYISKKKKSVHEYKQCSSLNNVEYILTKLIDTSRHKPSVSLQLYNWYGYIYIYVSVYIYRYVLIQMSGFDWLQFIVVHVNIHYIFLTAAHYQLFNILYTPFYYFIHFLLLLVSSLIIYILLHLYICCIWMCACVFDHTVSRHC